ncbi:MAG TPA: hypothetical protein VFK14_09580 [Solirubrobacterales bacterium]|nr:hypothetical protein [Solirubrobacterales bacterium]
MGVEARASLGLGAPLLAVLALVGCASGGSSASTAPTPSGFSSYAERPGQQATALRLDRTDCRRLAATVGRRTGRLVQRQSEPTPPNSRCQISSRGVHVSITLDSSYDARQRYENRMVEQVQFNAPDPARVPHHLPGVGDPAAGEHLASWIPADGTLYAVRGNRWLTVACSLAGETRPQRLAAAARLARQAFRLSARRPAAPRASASPARR